MILYFSATGNSKYAAERAAEATNDVAAAMLECKESIVIKKGEQLGIVTPTYSWELPITVRDFLENTDFKVADEAYVFIISTYGTTPGASGADAKHILRSKGIHVDAIYGVQMPDTWTVIFDLSDTERVAKMNKAAENNVSRIVNQITERQAGNHQKRSMPYVIRLLSDKVYQNMRKTSHFHVEDTCIGCGLCEKKCPVQAIEIRDGHPVWIKDQCAMCLGCLHRCPKFAIQYENRTKNHGQYRNPNVKI